MECIFHLKDGVETVSNVELDNVPSKGDRVLADGDIYTVTGLAYDLDKTPVTVTVRLALCRRKKIVKFRIRKKRE